MGGWDIWHLVESILLEPFGDALVEVIPHVRSRTGVELRWEHVEDEIVLVVPWKDDLINIDEKWTGFIVNSDLVGL